MLKKYKTPLRYPGGKSRAVKILDGYFPHLGMMKEYYEPFLGGGSVAMFVSKRYPHLKMRVNDLFIPLYSFWVQLQSNPKELHEALLEIRNTNNTPEMMREQMPLSRDIVRSNDSSQFERAVHFFVVNRCSFSGLGLTGGFSEISSINCFTINSINNLLVYGDIISNWEITNLSYEKVLEEAGENSFVYLDPPYDLGKDSALYGDNGSMHKEFDHDLFAENCIKCPAKQLISYNNDQSIIDRYKGWNIDTFDLTYTMLSVGDYGENQKDRKELIMYNYDIPNYF
jgi:DNA adenine methylase